MIAQPYTIPVAETRSGHTTYRVVQDYTYQWRLPRHSVEYRLTVPAGFECDGASVPRLLWSFVGLAPDGLLRAAAVSHDYLYASRGLVGGNLKARYYSPAHEHDWQTVLWPVTRKQSDELFARLLREAGVAKRRRRLAYLAVRLFGFYAWRT